MTQVEIPDVPGDPDGIVASASALDGAGAQLAQTASKLTRYAADLQWSGMGAEAARGACERSAAPLRAGDGACQEASLALRLYAGLLREAQRTSRQAKLRAQDAAADAARAQAAADAAALGPVPDPIGHTAAQRRVYDAQDEMLAAAAAGLAAYEDAKLAAAACASALDALAGVAPEPPPPPTAPESDPESGNWFQRRWGDVSDAWDEVGNTGSPFNPHSPAFSHDVIDGAIGAVTSTGQFLYTAIQAHPRYEQFDPEGSRKARDELADAANYAVHHPLETGGAIIGLDELTGGHPGNWVGDMGLNALLTMATGGAGATAKVTGATARISERAALAARMREALKVGDLRAGGLRDYSRGFDSSVDNFVDPHTPVVTGPVDGPLVNFGDGATAIGTHRSLGWWMRLEDARALGSVEALRDQLALPRRWTPDGPYQPKTEAIIIHPPPDADVIRREGPAAAVPAPHEGHTYPGGGHQLRIKYVDSGWIIARVDAADLFAGHLPHGVGP